MVTAPQTISVVRIFVMLSPPRYKVTCPSVPYLQGVLEINCYDIQSIWREPDEGERVGGAVSKNFLGAVAKTPHGNTLERCTGQETTVGGDIEGIDVFSHPIDTAYSFFGNCPELETEG